MHWSPQKIQMSFAIFRGLESFSQLVYLKRGRTSQVIWRQSSNGSGNRQQIEIKNKMFWSVCCKRDSNPRFATIHPPRNSTRQQQVADSLVVFSHWTFAGTILPSQWSRTTWTWWRWTSSTCSTGTWPTTTPSLTSQSVFLISGGHWASSVLPVVWKLNPRLVLWHCLCRRRMEINEDWIVFQIRQNIRQQWLQKICSKLMTF